MKHPIWFTCIALILALALCAGYWFWLHSALVGNWEHSGQFGDAFGALNTLFTGWAFVVVFSTLIVQSRQIVETKHDVEEERELQRRTATLLHEQAQALAESVRLNALTSRIEAYQMQIQDAYEHHDRRLAERLVGERRNLIVELDKVVSSRPG